MRRNSPRTGLPSISRTIFCDKSPRATAVMTRATSLVGATRSEMSWLTEDMPPAHEPLAGPTDARSCILPSLPTTFPPRTPPVGFALFLADVGVEQPAHAAKDAVLLVGKADPEVALLHRLEDFD